MALTDVRTGALTVVMGDGNDWLALERVSVKRAARVHAGDGNDRVVITDSSFGGSTLLDGGLGLEDTIKIVDGFFAERPELRNWETIRV